MAKFFAIDESGKADSASYEEPFVLAGVIVDESKIVDIRKELTKVKIEHNLDPSIEFHTSKIVHGKDYFSSISDITKRASILEDFYKVLTNNVEKVLAVYYRNKTKDRWKVESLAYKYLIERGIIAFDKIRHEDEMFIIVIDKVHYSYDTKVQAFLHNEVRNGIYTRSWGVTRLVVPVPIFMTSKECHILQLADLVAYTVRRSLYREPSVAGSMDFKHYMNEYIKPKIDRCRDGRIMGCGIKELKNA